MDFKLTDDQQDLVNAINELAAAEFAPKAFTWGGEPPWPNLKRLAELGYLGLCLPEEIGGSGMSPLDGVLVAQTLARHCPSTAAHFHSINTGPATFIARFGSDFQKQKYLPDVLAGEKLIRISITEPHAGSDVTNMRTNVAIDGDMAVINGGKIYCSHAHIASAYIVYARFGPDVADIGCVIVDRDTPGLTLGPLETYMSGEHFNQLYFDNCRVPVENILLRRDAFKMLMGQYSIERCGNAARSIGISEMAIRMTADYMLQREQFGQRLADFQGLQWMLAEMVTRTEGAKLLLHRAMAEAGDGFPTRLASSMAKYNASETASFVTDQAMQIHGAMGIVTSMPLEWLYRTVRGWRVAGGSTEVLKNGVAKETLKSAAMGTLYR